MIKAARGSGDELFLYVLVCRQVRKIEAEESSCELVREIIDRAKFQKHKLLLRPDQVTSIFGKNTDATSDVGHCQSASGTRPFGTMMSLQCETSNSSSMIVLRDDLNQANLGDSFVSSSESRARLWKVGENPQPPASFIDYAEVLGCKGYCLQLSPWIET
jgi:hypothetical protein